MGKTILKSVILFLMTISILCSCGTRVKTEDGRSVAVPIEKLEWSTGQGIVDGDRVATFSLKNESEYMVYDFEIKFRPKSGITDAEKTKFYSLVDSDLPWGSDYLKSSLQKEDVWAYAKCEKLLTRGKTSGKLSCYYGEGFSSINSSDVFKYVEPDIATYKYVSDGKIYTCCYDYINQEYTLEKSTPDAQYWTKRDIGDQIPKAKGAVIEESLDLEDYFAVYVYGVSKDTYDDYVNACKKKGFTLELEENEYTYLYDFEAKNSKGYTVAVDYWVEEEQMEIVIKIDD